MAVVVDDLSLAYREVPQLVPPHTVAYPVSLSPIILLQMTTVRGGGRKGGREREGERGRERGREQASERERREIREREMHCQTSSHKLLYRYAV